MKQTLHYYYIIKTPVFLAEGKLIDTNQELLAIGLSNVGNSLFHGFAGTGAIARGALNYSSGVRTPLGGLYTGTLIK